MIKTEKKEVAYSIFVVLSLLFHVFNNFQLNESIKVFHLFSFGSICFGLMLNKESKILPRTFIALMCWTILSSILSPIDGSLMLLTKFIIVLLSVLFIPYISLDRLIIYTNMIIPIALMTLLWEYKKGYEFRFQGFYNDPNYLCTTLLLFYFYVQLLWKLIKSIWLKIFLFLEICIIFILTTSTISRTGLFCFCLITVAFGWDIIKRNKLQSFFIGGFVLFLIYVTFEQYIFDAIAGYANREERSDSFSEASNLRWEISMRGISYIISHPFFLLQGIGTGCFLNASNYLIEWDSRTRHIDHNTLTNWLTEQGLVGLILLFRCFFIIIKRIKFNVYLKSRNIQKYFIVVLIVFGVFSTSINQTNYLPFWFLVLTMESLSRSTQSLECVNDIQNEKVN